MAKPTKENVLGHVDDLVAKFLYYDRKDDEDLPRGTIEGLIKEGKLTTDEIVLRFKLALEDGVR